MVLLGQDLKATPQGIRASLVLLALSLLVGCGGGTVSSLIRNGQCPVTLKPIRSQGVPGASKRQVPFAAGAVLVCVYRHGRLQGNPSALIVTAPNRVAEIERNVNSGVVQPQGGTFSCGGDTGYSLILNFSSADKRITVSAEPTGCARVENGDLSTALTDPEESNLRQFVMSRG